MSSARRSLACLALGGGLGILADLSRVWLPDRLGPATWLLWAAPVLLLAAGLWISRKRFRRRRG